MAFALSDFELGASMDARIRVTRVDVPTKGSMWRKFPGEKAVSTEGCRCIVPRLWVIIREVAYKVAQSQDSKARRKTVLFSL